MLLNPVLQALSIVASSGVDLHPSFSLEFGACLFQPFPVQFLQILSCRIGGVLAIGVLQGRELVFSQGFEQSDFISELEDVEVEEFELDSGVLFGSDGFSFLGVPVLDLLLCQMVPSTSKSLTFC